MMIRTFAILLLGSAAVFARAAGAPDLASVEDYIRSERERQRIPGLAVAVVRNGSVVLEKGYGEANVEHHVPVTPETIFQSGSVGKQFTAALVMLLVEDGRISLSDPLTRFFPDAPAAWRDITVRHLLTHTSGLPDYTSGTIDYRRDYSEDDLLKFAFALTPEFRPGARWNYSNTGYVLLGILIGKVSGQFYGDLLRERIFTPLGMKAARIITEEEIVPHRASGYRLVDGQLRNQAWVAPKLNTTADGSLYLSLRDTIAWERAVRERRVLKPDSWSLALAPVTLNSGKTYPYGFGWAFESVAGRRVQRHGGSWQGFKADIAHYPEDALTIIVLANLAQADPGMVSDGIAARMDSRLKRPALAPIPDVPEAQARARRVLQDAALGTLSPPDFAYLRAGFFPEGAKRYAELLAKAGPIAGLTLLQHQELGDDRIYIYDVRCANATLRMRLGIAPDEKISVFDLRPR